MHRRVLFLTVLLCISGSLAAQVPEPGIGQINPSAGHAYGGSYVIIRGFDMLDRNVNCAEGCGTESPCPLEVLFGGVPGRVHYGMSDYIAVWAPAHAPGLVDVVVRMQGGSTFTRADGFRFANDVVTTPFDYVTYLVPVVAEALPGANGSIWQSEITVFNDSAHRAVLVGPSCNPFQVTPPLLCYDPDFAPGEARSLTLIERDAAGPALLYVPRTLDDDVALELRVRDLSRDEDNWGTELPLIDMADFTYDVTLLDVPNDPRYRASLRLYGQFTVGTARVLVHPMDQSGASIGPLADFELTFPEVEPSEDGFDLYPKYLSLDPLTAAVRASGHDRLRIEVRFHDGGIIDPPIFTGGWAFVSLTNNTTQQVTAITPHQEAR